MNYMHPKITVNIIGAGRVGQTIGKLLVQNQLARILAIHNQTYTSTLHALEFIGDGQYCARIRDLPTAKITLICVPDDAIPKICEFLRDVATCVPKSIILHCSGALTSDILAPMRIRDCFIASIHPMHSFADPSLSVKQYPGTY